MLKSFSVNNFRNLRNVKVDFSEMNILIGANNSGKTNLIKAISFFSDMLLADQKGSAFYTTMSKNGWSDVLTRQVKHPGIIDMEWEIETSRNLQDKFSDLKYKLSFSVGNGEQTPTNYFITDEEISYSKAAEGKERPFEFLKCHGKMPGKGKFSMRTSGVSGKLTNIELDVLQSDTVFKQMDQLMESEEFRVDLYPNFNKTFKSVKGFFEKFLCFSSTQFDLDGIKSPVDMDLSVDILNRDASNFLNVLRYFDNKYGFFDKYAEVLKEFISGVEKIWMVDLTEKKRMLKIIINGHDYRLYELSDGTLKMMVFALLLFAPEKSTILAIDEPEINIHPAWLSVLSQWFLKNANQTQSFLSTHSPDFLDGFTDSFRDGKTSVFVFELQEDAMVKKLEYQKVKSLIDDGWKLGDLYRVGDPRVGGWPW